MKIAVIIPAAGSGSRFGGEIPKQFVPLAGKPILQHVIERFIHFGVDRIVVAVAEPLVATVRQGDEDRVRFVAGGATRQESVTRALRALRELDDACEIVAVHDSVRPFLRQQLFDAVIAAAAEHGAALPALPVTDTIHAVRDGAIARTLDRDELVAAQTPQCFRLEVLRDVLEAAFHEGRSATDEAALAAFYGHRVALVPGDPANIKITRPEDLAIAEANFEEWSRR